MLSFGWLYGVIVGEYAVLDAGGLRPRLLERETVLAEWGLIGLLYRVGVGIGMSGSFIRSGRGI
jgi:hypothetical protein